MSKRRVPWGNSGWPPWMTKMELFILCITMATYCFGKGSACPPAPCSCPNSTSQVQCQNAGFDSIPRNLPSLTSTLDLTGNRIHTLSPSSLAGLRNVVNLKLKENQIQVIHDGAFFSLDSLQTLDLSSNQLTTLSEHMFQGAVSLLHLDLSNNQLSEIDGGFAKMYELSRLDLHNNRITEITQFTFRDLRSLRYILLAHNRIHTIDRKAFKNLEKLMYLVLEGNPIGDIPRFQFNSLFLSYVDLSDCGLTTLPRGLPNSIRYLQLRRNNMTEIRTHTFQDCPYISILVLDDNGITNIHEGTFDSMPYLQQLWLNNNHLRRIPQPLPVSLQRLLMDSNNVESVTDVFPVGSNLNDISLMGNNISNVSFNAFSKLSKLKSVDLSNNKIVHIYGNTFHSCNQVEMLQLSKNPLRFFHSHAFHGLGSLHTLSLAYIPTIVSMHSDIFRDFTNLTKLDLDSSQWIIKTILSSTDLLSSLSTVQDLSMVSSDLTELRMDFPNFFPQLKVLHISSPRWHCDRRMIWFRNWLLSTSVDVENVDDIQCYTPEELHAKSIITLTDFEFVPTTTLKVTTPLPTAGPLSTFPSTPSTRRRTKPSTTTPTMAPSTQTTPQPPDPEVGESPDTGSVGDSGKVDADNPPGGTSRRPPTWDEVLSMSSMIPINSLIGLNTPPVESEDSNVGEYNPGGVQNDNVDIQTLPPGGHTTIVPTYSETAQNRHGGKGSSTMTIIIATTIATIIIAAVLIFIIVYLSRKHREKQRRGTSSQTSRNSKACNSKNIYQNGIKYKNNKNDVLYFMPKKADGGTSDSLKTTSSSTKEAMALIPGRDINHEGPLRVYKWEDF